MGTLAFFNEIPKVIDTAHLWAKTAAEIPKQVDHSSYNPIAILSKMEWIPNFLKYILI